MEKFLKRCGLSNAISRFTQHRVGVRQIHNLSERELEMLFPLIGERHTFKVAMKRNRVKQNVKKRAEAIGGWTVEDLPDGKVGETQSKKRKRPTGMNRNVKIIRKDASLSGDSRKTILLNILKNNEAETSSLIRLVENVLESHSESLKLANRLALFPERHLIDYAEGKINCPACPRQIMPYLRKLSPVSWKIDNFKRHLENFHADLKGPCVLENVAAMVDVVIDAVDSGDDDNVNANEQPNNETLLNENFSETSPNRFDTRMPFVLLKKISDQMLSNENAATRKSVTLPKPSDPLPYTDTSMLQENTNEQERLEHLPEQRLVDTLSIEAVLPPELLETFENITAHKSVVSVTVSSTSNDPLPKANVSIPIEGTSDTVPVGIEFHPPPGSLNQAMDRTHSIESIPAYKSVGTPESIDLMSVTTSPDYLLATIDVSMPQTDRNGPFPLEDRELIPCLGSVNMPPNYPLTITDTSMPQENTNENERLEHLPKQRLADTLSIEKVLPPESLKTFENVTAHKSVVSMSVTVSSTSNDPLPKADVTIPIEGLSDIVPVGIEFHPPPGSLNEAMDRTHSIESIPAYKSVGTPESIDLMSVTTSPDYLLATIDVSMPQTDRNGPFPLEDRELIPCLGSVNMPPNYPLTITDTSMPQENTNENERLEHLPKQRLADTLSIEKVLPPESLKTFENVTAHKSVVSMSVTVSSTSNDPLPKADVTIPIEGLSDIVPVGIEFHPPPGSLNEAMDRTHSIESIPAYKSVGTPESIDLMSVTTPPDHLLATIDVSMPKMDRNEPVPLEDREHDIIPCLESMGSVTMPPNDPLAITDVSMPQVDANEPLPIEHSLSNETLNRIEPQDFSTKSLSAEYGAATVQPILFEDPEQDIVRCICGLIRDEEVIIQCYQCFVWQHTECMNVNGDVEIYLCERCGNRKIDLEIPLKELSEEGYKIFLTLMRGDLQVRTGDTMYILRDVPILCDDNSLPKKHTYETIGNIDFIECDIFRVQRLWKDEEGKRFAFGYHYLRPQETFHKASKKFYVNEVVQAPIYEEISIDLIMGRCWVLDPTTFCKGRPIPCDERHVFICEHKIDKNRRVFTKISKQEYPFSTKKSYAFRCFGEKLKISRNNSVN